LMAIAPPAETEMGAKPLKVRDLHSSL
jgi:hypothetical protein